MTAESPMLEIAALIADAGGGEMVACMQCGTCTAVCPWPMVDEMSPRGVIRQASLGLEGWESEWVWRCVTCRACVQRCPRGLDMTMIMQAARAVLQESGSAPRALGGPLASLRTHGNPWEGEAEGRREWNEELGVPTAETPEASLLVPCCTQIYDARSRRASFALVSLMKKAGIAFATAPELRCCGEQAARVGAQELATSLSEANVSILENLGVRQVVAASPHCMRSMRNSGIEARHTVELLWRYAQEGLLGPPGGYERVVTYHDPCYLGRWAGVYEPPRELLRWIDGLELAEMPRNRKESLCCGAGGGGVWMELPIEKRFAVLRVREALETGATVLATACPYCLLMFDDAVKVLEVESRMMVRTVEEILAESLGLIRPEAAR